MIRIVARTLFFLFALSFSRASFANPSDSTRNFLTDTSRATFHAQITTITQYHGAFHAAYSGLNSLASGPDDATSVTSTLFAGVRLWHGASFYFNPELGGGKGTFGGNGDCWISKWRNSANRQSSASDCYCSRILSANVCAFEFWQRPSLGRAKSIGDGCSARPLYHHAGQVRAPRFLRC